MKDLRNQSGQAMVVLVAGCLAMFVGLAVFAQYGSAFIVRGQLQRDADLAATAAAAQMGKDYPRLTSPAVLANGAPNPFHLSRSSYVSRARAAASRSAVANKVTSQARSTVVASGVAPTKVTVTFGNRHRVKLAHSQGNHAPSVKIRATATAQLKFAVAPMPDAVPASASGGGYDGPLAYRQGKAMRPDVAQAFDAMFAAAKSAGLTLSINSAFRSDAEQARLFAQHPDPKWVAPPGTSLHRYGTELDIGPPAAYGWLAANAHGFGFIKRYAWEPWHFGFGANPRDVPAQYERGSWEPPAGHFDGQKQLPSFVPQQYAAMITDAAQQWNVQPELLAAQLSAESGFNPNAVSPTGAQGIAQFMPATAQAMGLKDPFDPRQAINAQAKLMSGLIRQFKSIPLALAAYNAGAGAVTKYHGIPPYAETQAYVARILSLMKGGGVGLNDPAFAGISVTASVELVK